MPDRIPFRKILPLFSLLACAALLSGCATTWKQHGVTRSRMDQELGQCELQAAKRYPPKVIVVEVAPGYWSTATEQCWHNRRYETCQHTPSVWRPATYENENENAPAQRAWVHACMRSLGFHG